MITINKLLANDLSGLSDEEQEYAIKFNESLRVGLIDELVEDVTLKMIKSLEANKDEFKDMVGDIIIHGCKGLKDMSTQQLLNLYLEKKSEEAFVNLIEKIT